MEDSERTEYENSPISPILPFAFPVAYLPMSWLLRGRTEKITVRSAVPTNRPALALLLAHTWRRHGIMAVEEQVALLSNGLSAIVFAGEDAIAFLGLSPRSPAGVPPEHWVDMSLIAVASNRPAAGVLRRLCETAIDGLRNHGTTGLVCLANEAWLVEGLTDAGFREIDQVLSYARSNRGPMPDPRVVCELCPAGSAQAETVLALNAAAFEPIWHYDDRTVLSWLLTADHAVLAEQAGQPLGFALTTLNSVNGYAQLIPRGDASRRAATGNRSTTRDRCDSLRVGSWRNRSIAQHSGEQHGVASSLRGPGFPANRRHVISVGIPHVN